MGNCIKCGQLVALDSFQFCPYCGATQTVVEKSGHRVKSRGNGQGSAFRRINPKTGKPFSTWTVQYVYDWKLPADPSKPKIPMKRTKAGFATKKDALDFIATLKISKPKEAPKLSYYWDTYEAGKYTSLSPSKKTAYRIAWSKMKDIHNITVDNLTVDVLQRTINRVCTSYYTAKDCKTVLIRLYKLAAADGFANVSLPTLLELPKLLEKEQTPFTQEEQKALWRAYDNGEKSVALPLLMIYTGMMPGEVQHLRVDQIDLDGRVITGVGMKTKTRKQTPVVLSETVLPVIQTLIENARPDGNLWQWSKDDWYEEYYHALEVAGVRKLTPYSCRHTTATALAVDQNVAPQTIKKIMRWSTSKMLDRYAHPDTQDALDGVNKLKKD